VSDRSIERATGTSKSSEVVSGLSKESHLLTSQAASRRAASFSVLGLAGRTTALAMVAEVHPAAHPMNATKT
jgi:hypothetical protein